MDTRASAGSSAGTSALDADVLIVGLGPTGVTAAALLAQQGLRVMAFDRLPDLYPMPRAAGFDHEVMRIMQELGISDRVSVYAEPYRPSEYLGMDGQLIKRLDAAPPPYRTGWAPNYVFNQPAFEYVLRDRLAEMPRVSAHFPAEVTAVGQEADHAWLEVNQRGVIRRVTGRYLIACDGGSSPIRKSLGIELEDLGFDEPWLVVDVLVTEETARRLPQTQVQYCEAARPSTFVVGTGLHRRWEIMLKPGDSLSPDFPENELWPLLSRWIKPGDGKLWRAATYVFHGLIAKEWRRNRIILAGDAVHMTPPFMAQGMVQGMRDAHNLTWKLARTIRGLSPDSLLDSYQAERRPHVEATTKAAISLGRVICEQDPERARARDARLRAEQGGTIATTIRQSMIPELRHGVLSASSPGAGSLFPQPTVRDARSGKTLLLDDLTGARFRLVAIAPPADRECVEFARRLTPLGGCLVGLQMDEPKPGIDVACSEVDGQLQDWLSSLGQNYALVRPDHYVYATAATHFEAVSALDALTADLMPNPSPAAFRVARA